MATKAVIIATLFIASFIIFIRCKQNKAESAYQEKQAKEALYIDCVTKRAEDSALIADLYSRIDSLSLHRTFEGIGCDRIRMLNDSLNTNLFLASYKVERVRYYLNITLRNPSQTKFLKGWIKRAIE